MGAAPQKKEAAAAQKKKKKKNNGKRETGDDWKTVFFFSRQRLEGNRSSCPGYFAVMTLKQESRESQQLAANITNISEKLLNLS